jgi:UDP-3-O-[3-hydroxymyristoyl] N-acetylglucosamine deacetylase
MQFQQTIKRSVACHGIGIHSGRPAHLVMHPAPANSGVNFIRTDLPGAPVIPARSSRVVDSNLATTLGNAEAYVSTVEHLLAALAGMKIDNARIELSGPELPILDGSAAPFTVLVQKAGVKTLKWPRAFFQMQKSLAITEGDKYIGIEPAAESKLTYSIDFPHPAIGRQEFSFKLGDKAFCREIAPARTFGFLQDVQKLQANGQALGGSLDNAIVLGPQGIMNPEGLRFPNEFVRHKILDLIGDLALLGWPVLGHIRVTRGSHALHQKFMQALLQHQETWRLYIPQTQASWRPSLPAAHAFGFRVAMA